MPLSRRQLLRLGSVALPALALGGIPSHAASTLPMNPSLSATSARFRRGINLSHYTAQHKADRYGDPARFREDDPAWIASVGFDHVRLPIDGRLLGPSIGTPLFEELMAPIDRALDRLEAAGLGVLLDMHFLPGADFMVAPDKNALWTDPALQEKSIRLWTVLAQRYLGRGPWLRFELLNEAVAPSSAPLNRFNAALTAAIHAVDASRVVLLSSNRWGSFGTVPELELPAGPGVALAVHFYDPFPFTHQRAPWVPDLLRYPHAVGFPTELPAFADFYPEDHHLRAWADGRFDAAWVDAKFATLRAWVDAHNPGMEVIVTELGVYKLAATEDAHRWFEAAIGAAERHGFGWSLWDLRGGFGIVDDAHGWTDHGRWFATLKERSWTRA